MPEAPTPQAKPSRCVDPVVGSILSSWRYDISQLDREMRRDYEQHLAECGHCRTRQRLHRTIDMVLIAAHRAGGHPQD
jgi:hypothetical protein